MTSFLLSAFFICSLAMAILKPSSATMLKTFSSSSIRIPTMMPFVSSTLAQNPVFLIISVKISLSKERVSCGPSSSPMFGKSLAGVPRMLNSEFSVLITTLPFSFTETSTLPAGSFLTMSMKSFALTAMLPGSSTLTSMTFSIDRSRSDADIFSSPSSPASKRMDFRTGIVVLTETAFDTIPSALESVLCSHENFISFLLMAL